MSADEVDTLVQFAGIAGWCMGLCLGFLLGMAVRPRCANELPSRRESELAARDASTLRQRRGAL